MKKKLIAQYRMQLETSFDQRLVIPNNLEIQFWEWFERKSKLFINKKIRTHLRNTTIPIIDNFCFKNSFRIAKGFKKRLFYYEGFSFNESKDIATKHAFNICKNGKVNDYTLNNKLGEKQDFYVGVKIPMTFARRIYNELGDYKFSQESLLVAYFMFQNNHKDYIHYTSP